MGRLVCTHPRPVSGLHRIPSITLLYRISGTDIAFHGLPERADSSCLSAAETASDAFRKCPAPNGGGESYSIQAVLRMSVASSGQSSELPHARNAPVPYDERFTACSAMHVQSTPPRPASDAAMNRACSASYIPRSSPISCR